MVFVASVVESRMWTTEPEFARHKNLEYTLLTVKETNLAVRKKRSDI